MGGQPVGRAGVSRPSNARDCRRRTCPGVVQLAGCTVIVGAREGSTCSGGIHNTRSGHPFGGGMVCHLRGSVRESSIPAWASGPTRVRVVRSVRPPKSQDVMWSICENAGGVAGPGAELAPSSPTRARYWSTDPSRRDRPRNSDRPWKSMTCRKRSRASQVSTSWSTVIRTPASVTAVPVRAASCSRVTAATMVVEPVQGQVPYHARNPRLWRRTVRHDAAGRGCGCPPQRDPALCHALRHRQHRRRR